MLTLLACMSILQLLMPVHPLQLARSTLFTRSPSVCDVYSTYKNTAKIYLNQDQVNQDEQNNRKFTSTALFSQKSAGGQYESALSWLNKSKGILVFYAVMLSPIYGIGIPFFGSMTDFNTV